MNNLHRTLGLIVLVVIGLAACGDRTPVEETQDAARLEVRGAGATFPEPLYARWISHYSETHPDVRFVYEGGGSGAGVKRFIAEEVDFGASDAAMNDAEIAQVERGVKLIPMTAGMVVLAYNLPGYEGELRLPRDVYVDIFLGEITRWNDERILAANPGAALPNKPITMVVRRDGSGTTYAFTNHLSAISEKWSAGPGTGKLIDWPGNTMTAPGNEGVAQRVLITRNSIGYMEYGFAKRMKDEEGQGLSVAVLENGAGEFVAPSAASGTAALGAEAEAIPDNLRLFLPDPTGTASYPIVTLSWIMLYASYPELDKRQALAEALEWGLSADGQSIAEDMGYIPLSDNVIDKARAAIGSIR